MDVKNVHAYTSNEYLEPLTHWNEHKVYRYKIQILWFVISAILVYGIWGFVISYILSELYTFVDMLVGLLLGVVAFIIPFKGTDEAMFTIRQYLPYVVVVLTGIVIYIKFNYNGMKKLKKFVVKNHGEVAHPKKLFRIVIYLMAIISGVATIGLIVYLYYTTITNLPEIEPDLALVQNIVTFRAIKWCYVPIPVFGCFMGVIYSFKNDLILCPMCGRHGVLSTEEEGEGFGKRSFGKREYTETETRTIKTGTTTYTTIYDYGTHSDSKSYTVDNYKDVEYTRTGVKESGDRLQDYVTYCPECGYTWEKTEVTSWSRKLS